MTVHHINDDSGPLFTTANAHSGDIFDLTAKGAGMAMWGALSNTTIRFMASNQSATFLQTGTGTRIYDQGHGTHLTFTFGVQGDVTIYDFQHDATGHITYMNTATTQAQLSALSDGHGGTFLRGDGLTIHLVNDPHIAASQHS